MSLGTSDGQVFDSYMDLISPKADQNSKPVISDARQNEGSFNIDREHHVPLVASAILDDAGNPTGDLAIDHRVPPKPEYEPYLHLHEQSEIYHMNNLMKAGMNPVDAYHEAHDKIATPLESAAVRADMGEDGLEAYKKYWREAASIASEPTDRPRHPRAHTTVHGLDEGEGIKVAMAGEGANDNLLTGEREEPSASPEMEAHNKSEQAGFAMTRMLGGSRGIPVMPVANENKSSLAEDDYRRAKNNPPMTKEEANKLIEANPNLVKYAESLNKQIRDRKTKGKGYSKNGLDVFPSIGADLKPEPGVTRISPIDQDRYNKAYDAGEKGKSTTDQLRDWFRPEK